LDRELAAGGEAAWERKVVELVMRRRGGKARVEIRGAVHGPERVGVSNGSWFVDS
jgi:hypothetical protein